MMGVMLCTVCVHVKHLRFCYVVAEMKVLRHQQSDRNSAVVLQATSAWQNVWIMKWRVPGQEVDQRKLVEILWKKTIKHVD